MMGMEMMLKSFGINPEEIKQSIGGTVQAVQEVNARLRNLEQGLERVETVLSLLVTRIETNGNVRTITTGTNRNYSSECSSGDCSSGSTRSGSECAISYRGSEC